MYLGIRQDANVREIIGQSMGIGSHLFHAVGNDANYVGQDSLQVDAVEKPLPQLLRLIGRAASNLPYGVSRRTKGLNSSSLTALHGKPQPQNYFT